MKFEAYNPFENEFYKEISEDEYNSISNNREILRDFTFFEKKMVKDMFKDTKIVEVDEYYKYEIYLLINNKKNALGVGVTKLEDEWYIVKVSRSALYHQDNKYRTSRTSRVSYYKCDQLSGLEICIKDELFN